MELYKKYRPKRYKDVSGQPLATSVLSKYARDKAKRMPHTLLFHGPTGCGKTTLARITAKVVGCDPDDLFELNSAAFRGIDMVRDIQSRVTLASIGDSRVWIIDECHQLTGPAQDAFLKVLEEPPDHVWFFLCTTDPQKLKKTIQNRCTSIPVKLLGPGDMKRVIGRATKRERIEISDEVLDEIIEVAEGSPRQALVLLDAVMDIKDEEEQLSAITKADSKAQARELVQLLLNPRTKWPAIAAIIKDLDEEPESLRYMTLGWCSKVLLGGGRQASRAYLIIQAFADSFYESKKAGLVAACWEIVNFSKK